MGGVFSLVVAAQLDRLASESQDGAAEVSGAI